jgi:uncharacterized protein YcfJ
LIFPLRRTTMFQSFRTTVLSATISAALLGIASAASAQQHNDTATVLSATPITERVATPRRDCTTEQVTAYEERRTPRVERQEVIERREETKSTGAGTVLGAIIGGVVGHQFGNSSGGRDRGTAVGAVLGGVIGNNIENEPNRDSGSYRTATRQGYDVERVPVSRDVQRCNTVSEYREVVRGYDVKFRYNGRDYTTRMDQDPGTTIAVNVAVRPVTSTYPAPVSSRGNQPVPSYSRSY